MWSAMCLDQWFPTFFMPWPTCGSQQNVVAHHHRTIENATLSSFGHKYEQTKFVLYDNTSNFIQFQHQQRKADREINLSAIFVLV